MDPAALRERIESDIRRRDLIEPGGEVLCLVSGGADSTCLWHALGALGYRVFALHVDHGLRGAESDSDARFCRERFEAEVVLATGRTEAELRDARYSFHSRRLRATGHTASDQVETVLMRLVASGSTRGIKRRREDGVVRPLLGVWREETEAYCSMEGLEFRVDSSNAETKRGLVRDEILPLLECLDPRARASLLALAEERPRLPRRLERALADLLSSHEGTKRTDLGGGVRAVREYGTLRLEGTIQFGPWTLASDVDGLEVRARRPGDRLAGRRKKVQDLLVDAKVPRDARDAWPLVVHGEDIVVVPGIAAAPGWEDAVVGKREP